MRLKIIALCFSILVIPAGCGQKEKANEKINLLDTANPKEGFVTDTYAVTESALVGATDDQVTRHDRILDTVDPQASDSVGDTVPVYRPFYFHKRHDAIFVKFRAFSDVAGSGQTYKVEVAMLETVFGKHARGPS